MGVGDVTAILEHAYYSVISPEGCASILWKTETAREEAAAALKLTSGELLELGVVDEVIREPPGGAHRNADEMAKALAEWFGKKLEEMSAMPLPALLERRYARIRKWGIVKTGDREAG